MLCPQLFFLSELELQAYGPGEGAVGLRYCSPPKIWATFWEGREIRARPISKEVCMCVCVAFCQREISSHLS